MSGVYWGLTAMDLMGQLDRMSKDDVIEFVKSCQHPTLGGFSPTLNHDPHLLYTLSAIQVSYLNILNMRNQVHTHEQTHTQILVLYDSVNVINVEGVVSYIHSLQQSDGSFIGDKWGEMMHAYCNDIVMMSLLIIQEKLTQGFRSVVLLH